MTEHQDWNVVILNKKNVSPQNQNQMKTTTTTQTTKISNKGLNRQHTEPDNIRNIANSEEVGKIKTVSLSLAQKIQQARMEKKWTQKELANKINEQQRIIAEYESGKAIPNNQILQKLEKVLNVKLR